VVRGSIPLLSRVRHFTAAFVLVCSLSAAAEAQLQQGTIHGTILGPDGSPVDGAVVTLLDGLGNALTSVTSQAGQFGLTNVVPGTYSLRADAPPLWALLQPLTVGGALPVQVELRMSAVLAQQIVVQGEQPGPDSTTTRITLAGDAVRRASSLDTSLRSSGSNPAVSSKSDQPPEQPTRGSARLTLASAVTTDGTSRPWPAVRFDVPWV
jgi:hypothetical protein